MNSTLDRFRRAVRAFGRRDPWLDMAPWQREIVARVSSYTMASAESALATIMASECLVRHGIEGAFMEYGVWRGGQMMAAMQSLQHLGAQRDFYRKIDVVYCRGLADAAISLAVLKSIGLCSLPVMACPINARGAGDVAFLKSIPGWRWIAKRLDRQINAINLINSLMQEDLESVGIRCPRISRIPNGIPLSPPLARKLTIIRRMVWTGRLERQKGLDLMFDALARLPAGQPAWRLDLIGDGPLRKDLEAQATALGLSDRITFHGAVSAEEIRRHLVDADMFVLPSRYEGMSNSAIEAMEAGLPVLCTRCGGVDDLVAESAGWVCEPESVDALAATLAQALSEPVAEWASKGAQARKIVESRLSVEAVAWENLKVLESLVPARRSG